MSHSQPVNPITEDTSVHHELDAVKEDARTLGNYLESLLERCDEVVLGEITPQKFAAYITDFRANSFYRSLFT